MTRNKSFDLPESRLNGVPSKSFKTTWPSTLFNTRTFISSKAVRSLITLVNSLQILILDFITGNQLMQVGQNFAENGFVSSEVNLLPKVFPMVNSLFQVKILFFKLSMIHSKEGRSDNWNIPRMNHYFWLVQNRCSDISLIHQSWSVLSFISIGNCVGGPENSGPPTQNELCVDGPENSGPPTQNELCVGGPGGPDAKLQHPFVFLKALTFKGTWLSVGHQCFIISKKWITMT